MPKDYLTKKELAKLDAEVDKQVEPIRTILKNRMRKMQSPEHIGAKKENRGLDMFAQHLQMREMMYRADMKRAKTMSQKQKMLSKALTCRRLLTVYLSKQMRESLRDYWIEHLIRDWTVEGFIKDMMPPSAPIPSEYSKMAEKTVRKAYRYYTERKPNGRT